MLCQRYIIKYITMETITEDYVSFETAKLLTEKGFDNECSGYYNQERVLQRLSACSIKDTLKSPFYFDCIPAPTQQMAMKWLREIHGIHIQAYCPVFDMDADILGMKYNIVISNLKNRCIAFDTDIDDNEYDSYEEAVESGIKYCLEKLI